MSTRVGLPIGLLALALPVLAALTPIAPYEREDWVIPATPLDAKVLAKLGEKGIKPALPCSDEVFLRRVYLDLIGTLPTAAEVSAFAADTRPGKRAAVIESLFQRPEFVDYWTLKWGDLLRIKAEFPINLWPNAVQAYQRWVFEAVRANKPLDQFARELLTASGSNFRVGPVNFWRAVQGRTPTALADVVALTFLGMRTDKWPETKRKQLAAFFSRVSYKSTGEWKEEIVSLSPAAGEPLTATFPDGTVVKIPPDKDPRQVFADWLLASKNPYFARNMANRIWSWLMGRGVVHEPDDLRPDNPPANPELLAYLEKELVASRYDMRALFRLILNSRTYQQSSISRSKQPDAEACFAQYIVRRLDAEVLADALVYLTGSGEQYMSMVPEPFTYIPENQRTIALADGSITSPFLEMFGRPARDTGLEGERNNAPSAAQRLYLLNSSEVEKRLERSPRIQECIAAAKWNVPDIIKNLYVTFLSRQPTTTELEAAGAYFKTAGLKPADAAVDLAWALLNSKEFLYRH